MKPITIALPEDRVAQLGDIAREERRRPADQAAVMLIDALDQRSKANVAMNDAIRQAAGRGPTQP